MNFFTLLSIIDFGIVFLYSFTYNLTRSEIYWQARYFTHSFRL